MFLSEMGNVIITSCIICFANGREYYEKMLQRLTFKCFETVAEFSIPMPFTESI